MRKFSKLREFLRSKPQYYANIDYTRFPRAFVMAEFSLPKAIHVVGTNAKGSTGRFLAMILQSSGKKTAHYTSPHILDFKERFWLDARTPSEPELERAHEKLLEIFGNSEFIDTLSYFEWATLLAGVLFAEFDEIILEAGVGGEFDATNAFAKKLSIFTPVGLDHMSLLGNTLEQIATTKLNAMCDKVVVCAEFTLKDTARKIAAQKNCDLKFVPDEIPQSVRNYAQKHDLCEFLRSNLATAYFAARELGVSNLDQIVTNLGELDLGGRFQKIKENIWLDVGHNAHAAAAVAKEFAGQRVNLIYNAFDDKDVEAVLCALKPVIARIYVYHYESRERKLATAKIYELARKNLIECYDFYDLYDFKESEKYLIFGSFSLVGRFLGETFEK